MGSGVRIRNTRSTLGGSGNLVGGVSTKPDRGILEHFEYPFDADGNVRGASVPIGTGPDDLLEMSRGIIAAARSGNNYKLPADEVRFAEEVFTFLSGLPEVKRLAANVILTEGFPEQSGDGSELEASARREVLRRRIAALKSRQENLRAELAEIEGPLNAERSRILAEMVRVCEPELLRAARDWQCPPGKPKSAANMDLLSMNVARYAGVQARLFTSSEGKVLADQDATFVLANVAKRYPAFARVLEATSGFYSRFADGAQEDGIVAFHERWFKSSFARLEVGHKLAAALCLTDVPDEVEVRAPWESWSLVVPDGLLMPMARVGGVVKQLSRVWLVGAEPLFGISQDGDLIDLVRGEHDSDSFARFSASLRNLIRGSCLALSSPEDFAKESHASGSASKASKGRQGPPDLAQARFLLSAPVKVDLREHLRAYLGGRKGASPTVQFLVRGHWRNQVHGAGRALRKTIWIQPFWKGPEESRVLLRQHVAKGSEE